MCYVSPFVIVIFTLYYDELHWNVNSDSSELVIFVEAI